MLLESRSFLGSNAHSRLRSVAVFVFSLLAAGAISVSAHARSPGHGHGHAKGQGPLVYTDKGAVSGFEQDGVYMFLGIPYAAPPVGELRWQPPQPATPWYGTLDATEYANTCPQVTTLGPFAGPASITEDCLYLNVFTTDVRSNPKPVVVWIHGGGNITGESDDYDGSKLATGGPLGTETVVVTMNYRLGLLGFLSQVNLNAEGHPWGNYGILDIQAVLHWIQNNIIAFGGDPNNVTLGGQSAGSRDTSANLISPLAAGLFHRAINQSSPTESFPTAEEALEKGNAFAEAAHCSDAACLRDLSAARIMQLQGTPNADGPYTTNPFVDGTIIPINGEEAWTTGNYNQMPIMGGATRDEGMFGLSITEYFSGPPQHALTVEQWEDQNPTDVKAEYPLSEYGGNPTLSQNRINTDPGKCEDIQTLKKQAASNTYDVFAYSFDYQNAPYYFPQMPNEHNPTGFFQALAYHTVDIQFQFPGYDGGNLGVNLDQTTGQPRELQGAEIGLSDQLVAAWTHFAATGNPSNGQESNDGQEIPSWPVFTASSPTFLKQDMPSSIQTGAEYRAAYNCDFWDAQS